MRKIVTAIALAFTVLGTAPSLGAAETPTVNGQVRKIDADAGKITLKHDPIPNLDMDSMTMVFRIQDASQLKDLKVGDAVRFEADRVNGALTVTKIGKAK